ncbi:ATP synthase F1 subunit gamma [Oribacterium sp. C9]|uniref:ATP synthase F1 subunit gamma n=1 Tax=Oribacterium sp. C9 TaxID=1943579 RepID=UPI0003DF216D|nr:ATP synthase F1 subunit gamma [Oribacterium sp. C9]ETP72015.1 ATP synthase, F1 gamma subunit [Lachnospiraceae bacterium JC7]OON88291.1 ATP synthase F1 subunit gamma [Oribacterium sp. C9]
MATIRELRDRISSIDNTLKITNAMYLISSTKLRKAKTELQQTEPYFYTLQTMIQRILRHLPEDFTHPYLDLRENLRETVDPVDYRTAIICVTADKGLAGAYNHNVIKRTEELLRERPKHRLYVVGEMGRVYFRSSGVDVDEQFQYTAQNPTLHRARVITGRMLDLFQEDKIDSVYIVYTRMKNSLEMVTETEQLLPIDKINGGILGNNQIPMVAGMEDFRLRPTPKAIIDNVIPDYINGFIYSALVESFCSEQNARMTAMDAANRSGNKLRQELSIQYNRTRQAAITQEITEIAAGARAQKKR